MIRDKNKIYAEPNDPDTVLASNNLPSDVFVVGAGNKGIGSYSIPPNRILITNGSGEITYLDFNGQANKAIGTDASGNIVLIDRSELT